MIILASASPRRKSLLEGAGYRLCVEPADIAETHRDGESPEAYVQRISREKAECVAARHAGERAVVLAADTAVVHRNEVLGKPADAEQACAMLRSLRGDAHSVFTGVCVIECATGARHGFACETHVHFCDIGERRIAAYVATGEPMDKAGSYGIQGRAASFVSRIEGSYTNVVGLPLCETVELLERLGFWPDGSEQ